MFRVSKLIVIHTDTHQEAKVLCDWMLRDYNTDGRLACVSNVYTLTDFNNVGVVLEGDPAKLEATKPLIDDYLKEVTVKVEVAADQVTLP